MQMSDSFEKSLKMNVEGLVYAERVSMESLKTAARTLQNQQEITTSYKLLSQFQTTKLTWG